jgi:hypothetical protein
VIKTSARNSLTFLLAAALLLIAAGTAFAVPPVVKTVPWVAADPLVPHDTYAGKSIRLKGTSDVYTSGSVTIQYSWDFGDGTPATAFANVTSGNYYSLEVSHTYSGAVNTVYTARLTVKNNSGESASKEYYVQMRAKSLDVEVNIAIDEGLWYLHKDMTRTGDQGYWVHSYYAETPVNLNAFFVNGHVETGNVANPYTETVKRGMRYLFTLLRPFNIPDTKTYANAIGTVNLEGLQGSNKNNLAISVPGTSGPSTNDYAAPYAAGIFIDAIVASGTPNEVTTTGPANVTNRTYKAIVQDLVDAYTYGQTDTGTWIGGWGYYWDNNNSDNSVNQWATIGLLAADGWGGAVVVPDFLKTANRNSLNNTQATTANCSSTYNGAFSYTNNNCSFPWGPFGTTPSGMVQMVFDGINRDNAQWDLTENYIRNNFCNTGTSNVAIRSYYYGLFSFTKAMLLSPGGGIKYLGNPPYSGTNGTNPIDWYAYETLTPNSLYCNGVARTLVNDQLTGGNWGLHSQNGYHTYFSTAWAIIMLNRTVFESGVPVAVAVATPNPSIASVVVTLNGSASHHQDATKHITSWAWDLNNNGDYETPGVTATVTFPAVGSYVVGLRVGDDSSPQKFATTTVTVIVSMPPIAPTANAGGPYVFCPSAIKVFLDGSKTVNPDEGQHKEGNYPGDTIYSLDATGKIQTQFMWDLSGNGLFTDAYGIYPDVTTFYQSKPPGTYFAQLKVCDTTAASFDSGLSDLCSVSSARVTITTTCPNCTTGSAILAPNGHSVLVRWSKDNSADHYNVYRGTIQNGPYAFIGTTKNLSFVDNNTIKNTKFYYVVRSAALNDNETCQSNEVNATPIR